MWWDKDGLTSGGAECTPVRVFLVPSFCVFMCRLLLSPGVVEQRGFADHLACGGGGAVAGNGSLPWCHSAEGTHVTNAHGCWKAGAVEEKGYIFPLGVDCACGVPGVPVGVEGALLGYSWQSFVSSILCCYLLCLLCYRCCKKFRMPSMRRLRA